MIPLRERISVPAADALFRELIRSQVIRSCANCDAMNTTTNVCQTFKLQPPVNTMVFSCGDHWEPMIPF